MNIDNLPIASTLDGTEVLPIVQGEDTKQVAVEKITEGISADLETKLDKENPAATGKFSVGLNATASGNNSFASGQTTTASGVASHTEGCNTTASALNAHAEGLGTVANHRSQHVFGEWNTPDDSSADANARGNYIEIVGNGNSSGSQSSNARTLDWDGNETLAGDLVFNGSTSLTSALSAFQCKNYKKISPVATMSGYRAMWSRSNDLAYLPAQPGQVVKAYQVKAGERYVIQSFGYDVTSFDVAVIGQALVEGGKSTPLKQVITCGGTEYPADYTNHICFFEVEYDGYLYINEKTSTGVTSYACRYEDAVIRKENCLLVSDNQYTYFVYIGEGLFLAREFHRRGPNNLFQLVNVGLGFLVDDIGFVEQKHYMTAATDIIGPFSIGKSGMASNVWAGGNHSVNVGGVECPTAEELDLKILVNNQEITSDGIYWGTVRFVAKNKIYFAQTITGNTFEGATPAILETRVYSLTNTMNVEVYLEMLDDVRFSKYYGMQYVNQNVVNVVVPNDELVIVRADLESAYTMVNKQPDIILQYDDGAELHMILHPEGLGSYAHNVGTDGYGSVQTYGKTYHILISVTTIASGSKLYWSGEYRYVI